MVNMSLEGGAGSRFRMSVYVIIYRHYTVKEFSDFHIVLYTFYETPHSSFFGPVCSHSFTIFNCVYDHHPVRTPNCARKSHSVQRCDEGLVITLFKTVFFMDTPELFLLLSSYAKHIVTTYLFSVIY